MDLAKIRKKALSGLNMPPFSVQGSGTALADIRQVTQRREDPWQIASPDHAADTCSEEQLNMAGMSPYLFQPLPIRRETSRRTPLEIILAGREESGCNKVLQDDPHKKVAAVEDEFEEFLCMRVSDEYYGINILQIKEIIKPRQVTEVPRAPAFVHGVISLRGNIVPVLDLSERLGLNRAASSGRERIVVVKSGGGDTYTGLLVDQVTLVSRIASNRIESSPTTLNGTDRNFISGIGRTDNLMIILLNIDGIVDIQLS